MTYETPCMRRVLKYGVWFVVCVVCVVAVLCWAFLLPPAPASHYMYNNNTTTTTTTTTDYKNLKQQTKHKQ